MRFLIRAAVAVAALAAVQLTTVVAANAAVTNAQRIEVATSWTQPTAASRQAFFTARGNQGNWAEYNFDWSTDYCTFAPDRPFGFDFRQPCVRHDFGYRNFSALGKFAENKNRLDDALLVDMKAVCDGYAARDFCREIADIYFEAVQELGGYAESLKTTGDLTEMFDLD